MNQLATDNAASWINAHVLAESMYCPRAGMMAFEHKQADRGQELDRSPRLDYLPDFSVEMIEAGLNRASNAVWRSLTWTPPVVLIAIIAGRLDGRPWWLILIPAALFGGRWLYRKLCEVVELSRRLRAAHAALPEEPNPDSTQMQPVNWWSLLKAGFSSVEYEDSHEDPDRHFSGRPWRVLHKGSLRVPVFRKRSGKHEVRRQHVVRMAAYCHLLETCEGGQSPYGIVLFGDGYEGLTVPCSGENREAFAQSLDNARTLIEAVRSGGLMPDTPPGNTCCACPLGRPRVHRPGMTDTHLNGKQVAPFRTRGADQRLYHSPCGDRFDWVPPHESALEKGLR